MPTDITFDGITYKAEELTPEEDERFEKHYDLYFAPMIRHVRMLPGVNGSMGVQEIIRIPQDELAGLLQERKAEVKLAVSIAKNYVGGIFKGAHGVGAELAMTFIQPWHLLRTGAAGETPATAWDEWQGDPGAVADWANGDDNWIGFGAGNATAARIDKRVMLVILGYAEVGSARPVQTVRLAVNGVTYLPTRLQPYITVAPGAGRTPIIPCRTQIIPPMGSVLGTVYTDEATRSELQVLGFAIGESTFLQNHYLATVTL